MWASSSRGLYAFDPARRTVRQYGAADGLSAVELHRFGLHRDAAGRLYAGARDGLVGFDPLALRDNPLPPPLRRVGASVQRAGVRQELDVEAPLALRWNDVDLRVAYRALSYAGTPRYQFRLDGLESDWFDGGGRGERELGRLAPGRYALHVRAANAAGVWSAPAEPCAWLSRHRPGCAGGPGWPMSWDCCWFSGYPCAPGGGACSDAMSSPWRSSGASWPSSPVRPSRISSRTWATRSARP